MAAFRRNAVTEDAQHGFAGNAPAAILKLVRLGDAAFGASQAYRKCPRPFRAVLLGQLSDLDGALLFLASPTMAA